MMNEVSVIIPTYNRSQLLRKSIRSVIDQTYTKWEIIVVDDGSTDNTAGVNENFNDQITYIRQNLGPCKARNKGIAVVAGGYFMFLDSDDCLLSNNLKKLTTILNNNVAADVAYGWNYWFNEREQIIKLGPFPKDVEIDPRWPADVPPSGMTHNVEDGNILNDHCLDNTIMLGTALFRSQYVKPWGDSIHKIDFMSIGNLCFE